MKCHSKNPFAMIIDGIVTDEILFLKGIRTVYIINGSSLPRVYFGGEWHVRVHGVWARNRLWANIRPDFIAKITIKVK
jgi:hypothetical protein